MVERERNGKIKPASWGEGAGQGVGCWLLVQLCLGKCLLPRPSSYQKKEGIWTKRSLSCLGGLYGGSELAPRRGHQDTFLVERAGVVPDTGLHGHDMGVAQRKGVWEIPNLESEKYSELTRPSWHGPDPKLGAKA